MIRNFAGKTSQNASNSRLGIVQRAILLAVISVPAWLPCQAVGNENTVRTTQHVASKDLTVLQDAFQFGYTYNLVNENVNGRKLPTLTVGSVFDGKPVADLSMDRAFFSVWTRDLYWGFQGWTQAGDDSVLAVMKSSLQLLLLAKDRNQALGQSQGWPLNDERFYIPQAYTTGLKSALNFMPWNSESQAHFVLMARDYWRLTGDLEFIESIWPDICYITQTLELLDTNGNALPDATQGSYDYQGIGIDTEEPMLCATTYAAYRAVAELARVLDKPTIAERLEKLAARLKENMTKPLDDGGLWKPDNNGGYFINFRIITPGAKRLDERFIPYENLGPMFFGVTSKAQDDAIFARLDADYEQFYGTKYGPMYIAAAAPHEKMEVPYTSAPWLGFLDVYLRCIRKHELNRSRIFKALIDHAYDIPAGCFTEGLGIYGYLSGVAGRSWDNGNFFHTLIVAIYGIEKSDAGIRIRPPTCLDTLPLSELKNVRWRKAEYSFRWKGTGHQIQEIQLNGESQLKGGPLPENGLVLSEKSGRHQVVITLTK